MNKTATKLQTKAATIKAMLEEKFEITAKVTIALRAGMIKKLGAKALIFHIRFSGYATPMMVEIALNGTPCHVQKED